MRTSLMVALVIAGTLAGPLLVYAAADSGSGLLNVDIRDVPVKQAIDTIFAGTGLKYYVQPGVTGKIAELRLKGITLEEGLKATGDAMGFSYRTEDGAYIIGPGKAAVSVSVASVQPIAPLSSNAPPGSGPADQGQPQSAPVVVNNNISSPPPVFYGGGDGGGYGGPNFGFGNAGFYGGFGFPVLNVGGPPTVFGSFPQPPPPPGWVTPDVERFLRFNWAVPRRPGYAAPYPYFYP